MQTTQITVPTEFVNDIADLVKDRLQQRINDLVNMQRSLGISLPDNMGNNMEPVAENIIDKVITPENTVMDKPAPVFTQSSLPMMQAPAPVKVKKKRRRNPEVKRVGLLNHVTEVIKGSDRPLTTAEVAHALEKTAFPTRNRKDYNGLISSTSALLNQYTYKFDKRFERTKDDNKNFIYTTRNHAQA
jgi:hypothetical protein